MDDAVMSLIIGFVVGVVLAAGLLLLLVRQIQARHRSALTRYDESLVELRQERSEDKETNRRLRHELVANSPQQLVEMVANIELERDAAVSERDQAIEHLQLVQQDLTSAHGKLADRESKLRQYREALREIRESLEAQDKAKEHPTLQDPDPVAPSSTGYSVRRDDTGELARFEAVAEPVDLGAVD